MDNHKRRFIGGLFFVLILAISACLYFFKDTLLIHLAPKAVLTAAIKDVYMQLDDRFADSPLKMLDGLMDLNGQYTIGLNLDTENRIVGPMSYDMVLQADLNLHQLQATGSVFASDRKMQISMYADQEFMAVSSDELLNGCYYGITYDSFSKDIRGIPLLGQLLSDNVLQRWDVSVQNVSQQMRKENSFTKIQRFFHENDPVGSLAILALPSTVETGSTLVDGVMKNCYVISYHTVSDQAKKFLPDAACELNAEITVSFYLCEMDLVCVQCVYRCEDYDQKYNFHLGTDPQKNNKIRAELFENSGDVTKRYVLTVDTQKNDNKYTETLEFIKEMDGIQVLNDLRYDWEPSIGKLELQHNSNMPITLTLRETTEGICVKSNNFAEIIRMLKTDMLIQEQISGEMIITKGSAITVPEFKNLNQWSIDDFFILLSGIGSLIGVGIE